MRDEWSRPTQAEEGGREGRRRASTTYQGELVLDPFMGRGSTAVAAVETGRRWVGYETDADYAKTTRERVAQVDVLCLFEVD